MTNHRATCRIIETLQSPTTDAAIGCLIGLGHHELADQLSAAAYDDDFWGRTLNSLPKNSDLPNAPKNADPFWEYQCQDAAAGAKAFDEKSKAQAKLAALTAQVETIRQEMISALPVGAYEDHLGL